MKNTLDKGTVKIEKINIDANQKKRSFHIDFDFNKWKVFIYSCVFYCCGLFLGSYLYKISDSSTLDAMLSPRKQSILNLFATDLCSYFVLFLLVVFLGFCLIGFPLINIIPTIIGIEYGMRLSYLFINSNTKGIAYSIIMIIPFVSAFLTIISYSIEYSSEMSLNIYEIAKNNDRSKKYDIKPYLNKIFIFGMLIIAVSFISSVIKNLLFGIVTI